MSPSSTLHHIASRAAVRRLLACAHSLSPDDACLLLEDAVFAAADLAEQLDRSRLYGLQLDAEQAGVALIDGVQWLDDPQWLALIDRHPRCVAW